MARGSTAPRARGPRRRANLPCEFPRETRGVAGGRDRRWVRRLRRLQQIGSSCLSLQCEPRHRELAQSPQKGSNPRAEPASAAGVIEERSFAPSEHHKAQRFCQVRTDDANADEDEHHTLEYTGHGLDLSKVVGRSSTLFFINPLFVSADRLPIREGGTTDDAHAKACCWWVDRRAGCVFRSLRRR